MANRRAILDGLAAAWHRLLLLPLFTRVERDAALENPRRRLILRYIEQNPGCRFHELKRELGVPHGVLVHHLRILRQQGLLVFERQGRKLLLRFPGRRLGPRSEPSALPLIQLVHERPGLTIQEASDLLGWTRRTTSYRVDALVRLGLLRRAADGNRRRLVVLRREEITKLIPAQAIGRA